jgi:hypothetical protein
MDPGFLGISTDVGPCTLENLAIDIDPRVPRRVLRFAEDVITVIDTVRVDRRWTCG